jgi:glutamate racemase
LPGPNAPLGVFDSGLGGLTVARAMLQALPNERIVYLGDTARVPYGTRSAETVIRYARGCARVLIERGVKALVIACNTVSAVALELLQAELDLPVLGVVRPGAETAVRTLESLDSNQISPPPKVGVLGTLGTINSGAYPRAVAQVSTRIEVVGNAAPLLVPLVEEGWIEGDVPRLAVKRYVEPLIAAGAGVIVLGCTHYPLLKSIIAEVAAELAGKNIPVVDSAEATARAVRDAIEAERIPGATATPGDRLELLVTDLPKSFEGVASAFLGGEAAKVRQIDLAASAG